MSEQSNIEGAAILGVAGWKLIGGLAGLGALGAFLAAVIVICLTRPRTDQEWIVAIISTVMSSICGGAALIMYLGISHWAHSPFGLVAMLGIVFTCGLPGWALVRWVFNYINARQGATITEVAGDVAEGARKVKDAI